MDRRSFLKKAGLGALAVAGNVSCSKEQPIESKVRVTNVTVKDSFSDKYRSFRQDQLGYSRKNLDKIMANYVPEQKVTWQVTKDATIGADNYKKGALISYIDINSKQHGCRLDGTVDFIRVKDLGEDAKFIKIAKKDSVVNRKLSSTIETIAQKAFADFLSTDGYKKVKKDESYDISIPGTEVSFKFISEPGRYKFTANYKDGLSVNIEGDNKLLNELHTDCLDAKVGKTKEKYQSIVKLLG